MDRALVTPPAVEPLSLAEAKGHLRVVLDLEDTELAAYITAARQYAEQVTGRAFIQQVWEFYPDRFPEDPAEPILLPLPPLVSVDVVTYLDQDGTPTAWIAADRATYADGGDAPGPARLLPAYGTSWPSARDVPQAVTIQLTAGYGALGTDVPEPIRQAMRVHLARMYEHRDPATPGGNVVDSILQPFRLLEV